MNSRRDTKYRMTSHTRYAPYPETSSAQKENTCLSLSSYISIEASHSDSKQSRVRATQSAFLANASIWSNIIVRESVSIAVDICSVDQSRVVLKYSSSVSEIAPDKSQRYTHVCHGVLVVFCGRNSVRLLTR